LPVLKHFFICVNLDNLRHLRAKELVTGLEVCKESIAWLLFTLTERVK